MYAKMKYFRRKNLSLTLSALTLLLVGACTDWGRMDPPAGNQVYPKLQKIAAYAFDQKTDLDTFRLAAYPDGAMPELVEDKDHGSVLHLNGGYIQINNPLNSVKVQNGVSLTFWYKQAVPEADADQDLQGAIFSFQSEDGSQRMFFTANGWLSYKGTDGTYDYNDPSSVKTGMITPGEWHYVAMSVTNTGMFVYVDGMRKIDKTETGFDCSKIVQFMASVPEMYIGYGSGSPTQEIWMDDLTIYRNQITSKEIAVPGTGGGEEETNPYIIVGNKDMTTPWWTAFSDLVTMTGNQTMHFGFYNHTNQVANWDNWVLVVTNGKKFGDAGYAEYCVLRSDAFGWGDANYNGANITHNYNWDTFKADMDGAYVDLTIKRTDNRIDITAIITTKAGGTYRMTFFYEGSLVGTIGAFLTCEGSYLEIDPATVYVGNSYTPGSYVVGPTDLSAGWWSFFSNFTKITGNTPYPFAYTFINNTSGAANWDNWVLVCTNGKDRGEDGYAEYFVMRADAFGWGDANYKGANISHSFDWTTFTKQMKGATCMIILTRDGNRVDMTAKVTTATGVKLGDYTFFYEGISTTDIGFFFTVEQASLDMRTVAYYPFLILQK